MPDPGRGLLHVRRGKGRKDRCVMLSRVALEAIRAYRELETSDEWLFPWARPGRHLYVRTIQRVFERIRVAAGIRKRVGIHSLRHSFATHLLENGVELRYIRELMGNAFARTPRFTRT